MAEAKHTPGPWFVHTRDKTLVWSGKGVGAAGRRICGTAGLGDSDVDEANARLIAVAPELKAVADNFQIKGPDEDGFIWLVLHGNGTTGKAMFNLGRAEGIAWQVARHLEEDRRAAIAKASGGAA